MYKCVGIYNIKPQSTYIIQVVKYLDVEAETTPLGIQTAQIRVETGLKLKSKQEAEQ
jgi:hypothetical protein